MPTHAPSRTTMALAGLGFLIAGGLLLFAWSDLARLAADSLLFVLLTTAPAFVAQAAIAVSAVLLAFGVRPDSVSAGWAVVGRIALVVFGAGGLAITAATTLSGPLSTGGLEVLGTSETVLAVSAALCGVVGAVVLARRGRLRGASRWILIPVAAVVLLLTLAENVPSMQLALALTTGNIAVVEPVVFAAVGLVYLLEAVVRRRTGVRRRGRLASAG